MTENKYPYIPKEYYPATMFACKILRETRQFNRAINTASRYYNVDSDELAKHVRARQGAGQKGKKRGKMSWYAIEYVVATEYYDYFEPEFAEYTVVKALSEQNAKKQISKQYDMYGTTGFNGSWALFGDVKEFATEAGAINYARQMKYKHDEEYKR